MTEEVYAVESYNSKDNSYSRYDVGTKDDMMNLLSSCVKSSIEENDFDRYYRVVKVSSSDLVEWRRQIEYLPDVKNEDKLFGDWVQIGVASKYLGVTFGRVFHLVTSGKIQANTVGRNKLVSVHDVVDRKINHPGSGRPSTKDFVSEEEE